jgi:uncharacterized membrane protein
MKYFLIAHVALELVFGVVFLTFPQVIPVGFFQNLPTQGLHIARMYAYSAIAMGILGFLTWQNRTEKKVLLVALPTLAVFHTGISLAQIFNPMNSSEPYAAGVLHSILGFVFFVYYLKERKKEGV